MYVDTLIDTELLLDVIRVRIGTKQIIGRTAKHYADLT